MYIICTVAKGLRNLSRFYRIILSIKIFRASIKLSVVKLLLAKERDMTYCRIHDIVYVIIATLFVIFFVAL